MSIQITISINDIDEKILKNDLLDIQAWVQDAINGKVDSCFGRMRSEWIQTLMNDPSFTDPIPSNKDAFVTLITSLPEYKNRSERDQANRLGA